MEIRKEKKRPKPPPKKIKNQKKKKWKKEKKKEKIQSGVAYNLLTIKEKTPSFEKITK
jgi:23S rRNA U2552 (ribose-2'-O)-methylase RlmE/FtsJ